MCIRDSPYPLRGVSRHQDRKGAGVAITKEMMEEDMALILEMGANTIRLAHYQHAQAFYDLCDEKGLVIWAEIPYITMHMHNGRANTLTQMIWRTSLTRPARPRWRMSLCWRLPARF
mgnify:CR=1 FL=1